MGKSSVRSLDVSSSGTSSHEQAAKFFENFAEEFDTLYDNKRNWLMRWLDRHYRSDIFIRYAFTFEALGSMQGKNVLDIGCGSGPYVLEAFRRGAAYVTALDPAKNMLQMVKKRLEGTEYLGRTNFVLGAVPGTEEEAHHFVIVMGVMDYVADAASFLKEVRSLTKEMAVISFPSKHWFRTPLRKVRYYFRNCPLYFYDEELIKRLGTDAGFKEISICKIPGAGMDYVAVLK